MCILMRAVPYLIARRERGREREEEEEDCHFVAMLKFTGEDMYRLSMRANTVLAIIDFRCLLQIIYCFIITFVINR